MSLDRIVLSFPSPLHLAGVTTNSDAARRSWIQLARTGAFHSSRYGQFTITRDDLTQMKHNFDNITPKAPTELPIDYDHLSMDPKRPGDGIAAGWLKNVELRAAGDELWGEVEWTPDGAERIRKKEYRFVSPSFVKDHTHKDGQKIGTTLLAAAITNHPFLENMAALTLYNASVLGDLALAVNAADTATSVAQHLATIGQRVSFIKDAERTPELTDAERMQTCVIKSTVGDGDDQFVRLSGPDGRDVGWFRTTQLEPANAPRTPQNSPLPVQVEQHVEEATNTPKDNQMGDRMQTNLNERAVAFSARVTTLSKDRTPLDALRLATSQDGEGAEAYRMVGVGAETAADLEPEPAVAPVLSLSANPGESFDALAMRYAATQGMSLRDAIREVGKAHPELAAAR